MWCPNIYWPIPLNCFQIKVKTNSSPLVAASKWLEIFYFLLFYRPENEFVMSHLLKEKSSTKFLLLWKPLNNYNNTDKWRACKSRPFLKQTNPLIRLSRAQIPPKSRASYSMPANIYYLCEVSLLDSWRKKTLMFIDNIHSYRWNKKASLCILAANGGEGKADLKCKTPPTENGEVLWQGFPQGALKQGER